MADEKMIAHLGFIQGVINRMGNNSFLIKGWTVALVAAIFALSAKDTNQNFIYIALVPIVVFWFLDSYYLQQEKLFRALYDDVAKNQHNNIGEFVMDTRNYAKNVECIPRLMFTISTIPFYGLLFAILTVTVLKNSGGITLSLLNLVCK